MRTCIIASLRDSFLTKEAETALYNGFSGTHFVHKSECRTRDGAFIYALSADETSPALAALRHAITALFSCRFKRPCPPQRQRHFHGNADRAYNTLHFASKVVCQRVPLWKPRTTKQAEYLALSRCLILSLFCCQQPPFRGLRVVPCKLT